MQDARSVRPQILVVDDDPDTRDALFDVLTDAGYSVELMTNGQDALARLDTPPVPSAILSDVHMPVLDGNELAARLAGRSVPIILLSGDPDGPVGPGVRVLKKPISLPDLLQTIAEAVTGPPAP